MTETIRQVWGVFLNLLRLLLGIQIPGGRRCILNVESYRTKAGLFCR